jgi:23S rRNA (adenine2503-C2)-methyltransferase
MKVKDERREIRQLSLDEIIEDLKGFGEKPFRGRQIYEWLWKKSATSFEEMTNLSLALRECLEKKYAINPISIGQEQISSDGTIKYAFHLHDGHLVEGVLIPAESRMTACISSQVGCSLSCRFCATGYLTRQRNLNAGEIYDQVVQIGKQAEARYRIPLSNVVLMGMGEPLLNYSNVLMAIDRLTSESGLNMSYKRITLSTAGIAKMIRKLADDQARFNLALSLHAADDEKRNTIMPINESNSLSVLSDALRYYFEKTGSKITLEYIAFRQFNLTKADAQNLVRFAGSFPCKVNIIEYNPIDHAQFDRASEEELMSFSGFLERKGIIVNVRRSRGKDIDAACGQLANKSGVA